MASGARNSKTLPIQQLFNAEHRNNIVSTIEALSAGAFAWPQRGKLGLPIAENIRLNLG